MPPSPRDSPPPPGFPSDPLLARLTVQAMHDPCIVSRADLLELLPRAGIGKSSPIGQEVASHYGDYLTIRSEVVKHLLALASA